MMSAQPQAIALNFNQVFDRDQPQYMDSSRHLVSPSPKHTLLSPSHSHRSLHSNVHVLCAPSPSSRGETPSPKSAPNMRIKPMPRKPLPPLPAPRVPVVATDVLPRGWAKWSDQHGVFYLNIVTGDRCRQKPVRAATGLLREDAQSIDGEEWRALKQKITSNTAGANDYQLVFQEFVRNLDFQNLDDSDQDVALLALGSVDAKRQLQKRRNLVSVPANTHHFDVDHENDVTVQPMHSIVPDCDVLIFPEEQVYEEKEEEEEIKRMESRVEGQDYNQTNLNELEDIDDLQLGLSRTRSLSMNDMDEDHDLAAIREDEVFEVESSVSSLQHAAYS